MVKAKIMPSSIGRLIILIPDMRTMEVAKTKHDAIDWRFVHGFEVVEE